MENQVNPAGSKTPEEIEREMMATRESLTEKVVALEHQVVGTVQTAADTITGTVQAVRELVTEAPNAVTDTVKQAAAAVGETMKETLDISGHVRNNPWASVGVAAGIGFLAGVLIGPAPRRSRAEGAPPPPSYVPPQAPPQSPPAPSRPGMFDAVFALLGNKLKDLAETALESTTTSLKSSLQDGIPKLVNDAAANLIDTEYTSHPRSAHNGAHRARV